MAKANLTAEFLREHFQYIPETGELIRVSTGLVTGHVRGKYAFVCLNGVRYLSHRVAWTIYMGNLPTGVIDHIDGNSLNNRIANLRDVSQQSNTQNRYVAGAKSKTGLIGVHVLHNGRFAARIKVDGVSRHLGCFLTAIEAHTAYMNAKLHMHAGCVASRHFLQSH